MRLMRLCAAELRLVCDSARSFMGRIGALGALGGVMNKGTRAALTVVAAAALTAAGGAVALATHDTNTLHACAADRKGALRLVDSETSCGKSETPVAWNVQGPQGPQGGSGISRALVDQLRSPVMVGSDWAPLATVVFQDWTSVVLSGSVVLENTSTVLDNDVAVSCSISNTPGISTVIEPGGWRSIALGPGAAHMFGPASVRCGVDSGDVNAVRAVNASIAGIAVNSLS